VNAIGGRPLEPGKRGPSGFSIFDVLLATIILVVLGTALVSATYRSRAQLDYEEVRRRAILIAQERLEWVRADIPFDRVTVDTIATTIIADKDTFRITADVGIGIDPANADSLDDYMKTVTDTVSWRATTPEGTDSITRKVTMKTVIFRGLF
jgi:type II secretory pathway pseudopilin PulG